MSGDLVQQLRDLAALRHDDLSIGNEAADEITRLQSDIATVEQEARQMRARNERLEADLYEFQNASGCDTADELKVQMEAATNETLVMCITGCIHAHASIPLYPKEVIAAAREIVAKYCNRAPTAEAQSEPVEIDWTKVCGGITPFNPLNAASNTAPADKGGELMKAREIIATVKREIPRTMGSFDLQLLIEDMTSALGHIDAAIASTAPADKDDERLRAIETLRRTVQQYGDQNEYWGFAVKDELIPLIAAIAKEGK